MDSSDALSRSRCRERRLNKRSFFWSHKIPLWMWLLMQHWQHIVNNWWFVHSSWSDLSNRPSFTVHRNTSHMQIITCRAMELTSVATALKHRQYNSKPFRLLASYLISTVNLFKASGVQGEATTSRRRDGLQRGSPVLTEFPRNDVIST